MKALLNPLIELCATRAFGVDQYPDIFERLALSPRRPALMRRLCRRRLAEDIAGAPILFIHVPKNGGTSVKRALYSSDPGHASARYYSLFFPDWFASTASLAILREPVDRFLSGLDFLLNGGGHDVRIQPRAMHRMRHIRSADALLAFLQRAAEAGDWLSIDTFLRPQSWYLTDEGGRICVDHLWLLDRADEGLAQFLRERGGADLHHRNRTARQERRLSDAQLARLQAIYADDFALYADVQRAGGYSGSLAGVPVSALHSAPTRDSIDA